jgi:hypothetical protein
VLHCFSYLLASLGQPLLVHVMILLVKWDTDGKQFIPYTVSLQAL